MNENKRESFKRLANIRVNNALKDIRLIGNLANKNNYDYPEEDVKKIFMELDGALKVSKAKFSSSRKKEFKL